MKGNKARVEKDQERILRPKRKHRRKALWLGLVVVALVVGGRWCFDQRPSSRLSLPLVLAVETADIAEVRTLLDQGADPNARTGVLQDPEPLTWRYILRMFRGELTQYPTVLMEASMKNRVDIVRLLLERGADPNLIEGPSRQWTALHHAAYDGAFESMQALIAHQANVNAKDREGRTPLCFAGSCFYSWSDAKSHPNGEKDVRLLLEHGAKIDLRDNEEATPLQFAALRQDRAAVQALLQSGAEIDAQDKKGDTALHTAVMNHPLNTYSTQAAREDYLLLIRLLVDQGANVGLRDKKGKTALQIAEDLRDTEVATLLRKAAAHTFQAGKPSGRSGKQKKNKLSERTIAPTARRQ